MPQQSRVRSGNANILEENPRDSDIFDASGGLVCQQASLVCQEGFVGAPGKSGLQGKFQKVNIGEAECLLDWLPF